MRLLPLLLATLGCRVPPLGALHSAEPDTGEDSAESGLEDTDTGEPAPSACADPEAPWLETTTGCVLGTRTSWGEAFLGLPYAEPPVGELRFLPPLGVSPWEEPLVADALGSPCVQTYDSPDGALSDGEGDEDCLTLNIWRPEGAEGLPLLFFVHGGQFLHGSGGVPELAADPSLGGLAVVVTHNARLGPFGYLAHPGLDELNKSGVSGNQGLLDTLTALRWVNDNAAALGADPDRVLLVGQESGGLAACALALSPLAQGLMDGLFLQSAPCGLLTRELTDLDPSEEAQSGEDQGEALADALHCWGTPAEELACLQEASAEEIQGALAAREAWLMDGAAWEPVVDGYVLEAAPAERIAAGAFPEIPVFVSVNADEGAIYAEAIDASSASTLLEGHLRDLLGRALGVSADEVEFDFDAYTEEVYGSNEAAYLALYGHLVHTCASRGLLDALARDRAEVYAASFTHAPSFADITLGAYTGAELPFLFGTRQELYTEGEAALSVLMQATWLWALEQSPWVYGLGAWPSAQSGDWVALGDDGEAWEEADPYQEICAAIDATGWQRY